jgi:hypothetical protein
LLWGSAAVTAALAGREDRPGQLRMAELVADAIRLARLHCDRLESLRTSSAATAPLIRAISIPSPVATSTVVLVVAYVAPALSSTSKKRSRSLGWRASRSSSHASTMSIDPAATSASIRS